jgi:hypothetical protein
MLDIFLDKYLLQLITSYFFNINSINNLLISKLNKIKNNKNKCIIIHKKDIILNKNIVNYFNLLSINKSYNKMDKNVYNYLITLGNLNNNYYLFKLTFNKIKFDNLSIIYKFVLVYFSLSYDINTIWYSQSSGYIDIRFIYYILKTDIYIIESLKNDFPLDKAFYYKHLKSFYYKELLNLIQKKRYNKNTLKSLQSNFRPYPKNIYNKYYLL